MLKNIIKKLLITTAYILSVLSIGACSFIDDKRLTVDEQEVEVAMEQVDGISNLPHSQGLTFFTLDEYLAHLVEMGKQDRPFYELVEPNRYKLNIGRGSQFQEAQYFTREELLLKYGFSEKPVRD